MNTPSSHETDLANLEYEHKLAQRMLYDATPSAKPRLEKSVRKIEAQMRKYAAKRRDEYIAANAGDPNAAADADSAMNDYFSRRLIQNSPSQVNNDAAYRQRQLNVERKMSDLGL